MAPRGEAHGVLLLDKPEGFSSTQALARAKRFLASRKAGHTGTLDPFATGLLPLVFGEATKFSRFLIDATKAYRATLSLGRTSTTGDTEGEVRQTGRFAGDAASVDAVLARYLGPQMQLPPMHSAVHHGGRRLYDLAREGIEVERAPRAVVIHELRRVTLDESTLVVDVACSKGTYIRSLAMDIGAALGCGAYLTALRRTAAGAFRLDDAATLPALEAMGVEAARDALLPVDVLVAGLPRWDAPEEPAWRFSQGQVVGCPAARPGEAWAVFRPGGALIGVGRAEGAGRLAPERLLAGGGIGATP